MAHRWFQAAPAKVNLALHVTARRADGYHELESLVVFVDVADEIEASPAQSDTLAITGPFATGLSTDQTNLVLKAVAGFRARWPNSLPPGLTLHLRKNLPVAAGIGGGSADAAAVLRLLLAVATPPPPAADLAALALALGADVPACLVGLPLVMRGIGEQVTPLPDFPLCYAVLVNPLVPLATADVFRRLRSHDNYPLPALPEPLTRPAQLGIWLAETRNDLEPPARKLVPLIGDLIDALAATSGCILARMSGSGATVFGLFGSAPQAHQAAADLRQLHPDHWVAAGPLIVPEGRG